MATTPTISGFTSTQGAGNSSTFTVDPNTSVVSGGIVDGDVIVIVFSSQTNGASTNTPTSPGDWVNLVPFSTVGAGNMTFGVWAHKRLPGETTYSWSQTTSMGGQSNYKMCFIRGGGAIGDWITGTFDIRANTGTSTTNVAASITTVTNNSLALLLSGERTLTAETDAQVTCTTFTKIYFDNVIDSSLLIGTLDMSVAGATGSSTVTYPNTQANNGIAGIIGIPPANTAEAISWMV